MFEKYYPFAISPTGVVSISWQANVTKPPVINPFRVYNSVDFCHYIEQALQSSPGENRLPTNAFFNDLLMDIFIGCEVDKERLVSLSNGL